MHYSPPPLLIELPNGVWVRPDLITSVRPYAASEGTSGRVQVVYTDGESFIDCPDIDAATKLAARIAKQANAAL